MGGPNSNTTQPETARATQTAQTIQEQVLNQFYSKMSIILTLVVE